MIINKQNITLFEPIVLNGFHMDYVIKLHYLKNETLLLIIPK